MDGLEELIGHGREHSGRVLRMADDDGDAVGVQLQVVGVVDDMPESTKVTDCWENLRSIVRRTDARHLDGQAVHQLGVPTSLVIQVILERLGGAKSHLFDDVEDPDELVRAAFITAQGRLIEPDAPAPR